MAQWHRTGLDDATAQGVGLALRLTMTRFFVILGDGQYSFGLEPKG
jgi:hypothetical protein